MIETNVHVPTYKFTETYCDNERGTFITERHGTPIKP